MSCTRAAEGMLYAARASMMSSVSPCASSSGWQTEFNSVGSSSTGVDDTATCAAAKPVVQSETRAVVQMRITFYEFKGICLCCQSINSGCQ